MTCFFSRRLTHPIHLHGHDFWVLAQSTGAFDPANATLNTATPPRRDVASLPGNGHLVMAFLLDNPGAWITHCHIAWHASGGLALNFVESRDSIAAGVADTSIFYDSCRSWNEYQVNEVHPQDDSGI
jgi:hypothetical protein